MLPPIMKFTVCVHSRVWDGGEDSCLWSKVHQTPVTFGKT
jgi:hypothetical protein